jgi:sugar lactone lactonase YvrE
MKYLFILVLFLSIQSFGQGTFERIDSLVSNKNYTFNHPADFIKNKSGKYFVSDYENHGVAIFNSDKSLFKFTTLNAATLDLTQDNEGNVYVSSPTSYKVYKLDGTTGDVITSWGVNGTGVVSSSFQYVYGLCYTKNNTLLVSDITAKKIYEYNKDGVFIKEVNLFNAQSNAYVFGQPQGIAQDNNENLYITDYTQNKIVVFDKLGNFLNTIGSTGTAIGQLTSPKGIEIANNVIYVAETGATRIQSFSLTGSALGVITKGLNGPHFLSSSNDTLLIPNPWDNKLLILKAKPTQNVIYNCIKYKYLKTDSIVSNNSHTLDHPADFIQGIDGKYFVADYENQSVSIYNSDKSFNAVTNIGGAALDLVQDISGNVYVSSPTSYKVVKINGKTGEVIKKWGVDGFGSVSNFKFVYGLLYTSKGTLLVTDITTLNVYEYDTAGTYIRTLPLNYSISRPDGLAEDKFGNLYVSDYSANKVVVFDQNFNFKSEIAKNLVSNPKGLLVIDTILYIAETGSGKVQAFSLNGASLGVIASGINGPHYLSFSNNKILLANPWDNKLLFLDRVCTDSIGVITNIETEALSNDVFKIVPNPNNGEFKIMSQTISFETLEVYDMIGNKVANLNQIQSNEHISFTLTKGTYLVKGISNGKIFTKKMIIE